MFSYLAKNAVFTGQMQIFILRFLYLMRSGWVWYCRVDLVWIVSDLVNCLMAYPNLLTLWLMAEECALPERLTESFLNISVFSRLERLEQAARNR